MATVLFTTNTQTDTGMTGQGVEGLALDRYQVAVLKLWPRGVLWSRDLDTDLSLLTRSISYELARQEERGSQFLRELDPRTAYELLPDWERLLALPDCDDAGTDIASRQKAAHEKLTSLGGASPDFFVELAAKLGYTIIVERSHSDALKLDGVQTESGVYPVGDDWHSWIVHAKNGPNNAQLECAVLRYAHQHMTVFFVYDL